MTQVACSCGSQKNLTDCCLPLIQGKRKPETAEELLRARYTAFARGEVDYILDTHHSKTRDQIKREEIQDWAQESEWLGLTLHQKTGGEADDDKGTIVFHAQYRPKKDPADTAPTDHWEHSIFEKEDGEWKFLDAQGVHHGTYRRPEPKVGRNDPCACGSGKKFKKCCGVAH